MSASLSSLANNHFDGIYNNKCTDCKSYLDYMLIKNDQSIFRCFECKKYYKKDFNNDLINRFASTYAFCNKDINKFILLLRKGVYPYEYMINWKRLDEKSLSNKEEFYSSSNIEDITDITDVDYRHLKRVFEIFIGDYYDLYVQSDTLLLADVFENFRNKCIEIYEPE